MLKYGGRTREHLKQLGQWKQRHPCKSALYTGFKSAVHVAMAGDHSSVTKWRSSDGCLEGKYVWVQDNPSA